MSKATSKTPAFVDLCFLSFSNIILIHYSDIYLSWQEKNIFSRSLLTNLEVFSGSIEGFYSANNGDKLLTKQLMWLIIFLEQVGRAAL